jgi:cold shock CspA family protein
MRQQGIVRVWNGTYGFLDQLAGGPALFVHHNDVEMADPQAWRELFVGDRVEYESEFSDRGFHAVRVKAIEPTQPAAETEKAK